MLNNFRCYFYKFKDYQKPLEKYVFPLILLLFPLVGVNAGLDISDTTYNLGNYEYMNSINPMWLLATFLSNVVGKLIMCLPYGYTMLGFSIYSSFIISAIVLIAYYGLQAYMPGWMLFIGLFMCEGLCWCPRVIMYNNLTYLFMTLGVIFLLKGIFAWEKQNLYLFLAGVFLGVNVFVRFPNITEAAFILVLWFYCFITREKISETLRQTFVCILGYACGFGVFYIIASVMYGPMAYFGMIQSLFGMTEGASDYSSVGMISSIVQAYVTTGYDMIIMIPCLVAGIIMFMLLPEKYVLVKKILYILGLLILVKFYFSTGVFTRNYFYYDSMFQAAMMFVIIAIILSIIGTTGVLNGSKQEQTLAFMSLIIILITPLGSNNYTFPVINNLFYVAPITLWLMRRLMQRLGEAQYHFSWQSMITMVIVVTLIQGTLFRINFSFVDGADGQVRDATVSMIPKVRHMVTTRDNADSVEELYAFLYTNDLLDQKTILFGGIPGLAYVYDLEPAIDTIWPDLDSYTTETFDNQLMELSTSENPTPMIIVGAQMQDYANIGEKYDILLDYIANHDYNKVFESERFIVFTENK
ncbi:hypothetical protein [Butyrivibrio proteoclasticus]|uniref:hypothetical protein n=1 Tax=Butyrivibrio proteoclasticus TaxID=43305 RepID=UPI00047BD567|nr:hypothetical protein [Butyrivibrio proteoclasticus]